MSNIITIGYSTEGTTDKRFLESIIKRTFEDVAFQCQGNIEVYDPVFFEFPKNINFIDAVKNLSKTAFHNGIYILCIHTDADANNDSTVFQNKIGPALVELEKINDDNLCKIIVAIVPVQMTEAWILADKMLLKDELNTTLSDTTLGINRIIEKVADPKMLIENAVRISQQHLAQRRRKTNIGDLYQPIGQKIEISKLETLDSFKKFKSFVEDAFRKLNYLN